MGQDLSFLKRMLPWSFIRTQASGDPALKSRGPFKRRIFLKKFLWGKDFCDQQTWMSLSIMSASNPLFTPLKLMVTLTSGGRVPPLYYLWFNKGRCLPGHSMVLEELCQPLHEILREDCSDLKRFGLFYHYFTAYRLIYLWSIIFPTPFPSLLHLLRP